MQPPCFLITLKNHNLSLELANECIESGKIYGWNITLFEGINGLSITDAMWENINVSPLLNRYNMHKPGVQGCFMSHFYLWQKCVDIGSEIIILEHDAIFHAPWDQSLANKEEMTKLTMFKNKKGNRNDSDAGVWSTGLIAYLINPIQASKAINFCRTIGALPADVVMGSNVVKYKHLDYLYVSMNKKMNDRSKSTTNFL